jgi:hypothetical protein
MLNTTCKYIFQDVFDLFKALLVDLPMGLIFSLKWGVYFTRMYFLDKKKQASIIT